MSRSDIRRHNLELLIAEFGSISALSEASGVSEKYLSQLRTKTSLPSGKPRSMGDAVAERLETGAARESGWMDADRRGKSSPSDTAKLTQAEIDLLTLFRAAGPQKRRAIMSVARLLCND